MTDAEVAVREAERDIPASWRARSGARQLLRAEADASSRIEGLEMSHRPLERAALVPEDADRQAKLVIGNVLAMEAAIALGAAHRPLTPSAIPALHRELFAGTELEPIGWPFPGSAELDRRLGRITTGRGIHPANELRVPDLMEDLCEFTARDDVPAIAQAAMVHAQFETIHPFADGNGRIGCLIHVVLRQRDVAPTYVPPISLVLATDQTASVRGLNVVREYTKRRRSAPIGVFAQATRTAAHEAVSFADDIARLQARWRERAGIKRSGTTAE